MQIYRKKLRSCNAIVHNVACCCPQCCIILKTSKLGSCKTRLSAKTKFVAVNYYHTFLVELAVVAIRIARPAVDYIGMLMTDNKGRQTSMFDVV